MEDKKNKIFFRLGVDTLNNFCYNNSIPRKGKGLKKMQDIKTYLLGQKITCKVQVRDSDGIIVDKLENYRVKKIGRKYIYLLSDTYSSDGYWWALKLPPTEGLPLAYRC